MKNLYYPILLFQFLILLSCNVNKGELENNGKCEEINIIPNNDREIKLSTFTSEIQYIKLETDDNCLISRVDKLVKYKDSFFLFDSDLEGLFVFDKDGKFKYKILNKGGGPGEFIYMYSFCIDTLSDRIEIWDKGKRAIVLYNLNGQYLDEIKFENLDIVEFDKTSSGEYFIYNAPNESIFLNGRNGHSVYLLDDKLEIKDSYLPVFKPTLNWRPTTPPWYLSKYNNDLLLIPYLRNIVYSFNTINKKFIPKYYINFGKYNLPDEIIEKNNPDYRNAASADRTYIKFVKYLRKSPYVNKIRKFYESDKFLYFTYIYSSKMCHALYSKKTKNTITGSRIFNDIDGGIIFNPPIGILGFEDELLIGYLNINKLIDHNENTKVSDPRLQKLIDSSSAYDNPIIYSLKLKSF